MNKTKEELENASDKLLNRVSSNVKRLRQAKAMSQLDLALAIGLSGSAYLGKMEIRAKNHRFNLEHLAKIAEVLDVDIVEFFDIKDQT